MKKKSSIVIIFLLFIFGAVLCFYPKKLQDSDYLVLQRAFSDVIFREKWDRKIKDYKILIKVKNRVTELYWAKGRLLPEEELANTQNFRKVLYPYSNKTPDPEEFSATDIERIKKFTDPENRQNGAITPTYFYDAVFNTKTRKLTEDNLVRIKFLNGKKVTVHRFIAPNLTRILHVLEQAAATDEEIKNFLESISRTDGYQWREIRDTKGRSFHSYGLAVDILPKNYGAKIIYWNWQRDRDSANWMVTPLSERWSPPQKVIDIFEEEGFIWGGNWVVWDNMHFEYHPELIENLKNSKNYVY